MSDIEPFLLLDTETTGFVGQPWCSLCEIAVVLFVNGEEGAAYSSLVRPSVPYDANMEAAFAVNKLSWEELASAPTFTDVWTQLGDWLRTTATKHPEVLSAKMTAWNLPFDRKVMELEADRAGISRAAFPWGECSMQAYMDFHRMSKRAKLSHAYAKLKLPPQPAHEALADARMAGLVHAHTLRSRLARQERIRDPRSP